MKLAADKTVVCDVSWARQAAETGPFVAVPYNSAGRPLRSVLAAEAARRSIRRWSCGMRLRLRLRVPEEVRRPDLRGRFG